MKILLVNDYGTEGGGAELQMLAIRDALVQQGHQARLFSSDVPLGGLPPKSDVVCRGSVSKLQVLTSTYNYSARTKLADCLRDFEPDVVHVRMFLWQLSPSILSLLRDYPALYHVAVYRPICPRGTKLLPTAEDCTVRPGLACLSNRCVGLPTWVAAMTQRTLWRRQRGAFDNIVTLSSTAAHMLEADDLGRVGVLPNALLPRPSASRLEEYSERIGATPLLAYAGRLSPEKGLETLLTAFAEVVAKDPRSKLILAGSGPQSDSLKALAASLGLQDHVQWLGQLHRAELERVFSRAWVQVVPSQWQEPFGNVVTEALHRGTPVVASAVGAIPEIVRTEEADHGGGSAVAVLVEPGNATQLARELGRLLGDAAERSRLSRLGQELVARRYSLEPFMNSLLDVYHDTIAVFQGKAVSDSQGPEIHD